MILCIASVSVWYDQYSFQSVFGTNFLKNEIEAFWITPKSAESTMSDDDFVNLHRVT